MTALAVSVDKRAIVAAVRETIRAEIAAAASAARDAAVAATHEEARPENDKDTRGLEASYLARGQAARVSELELADNALEFLVLRDLREGDAVALGALVELEAEVGARVAYFVAPAGGGTRVRVSGAEVQVVSPQSPVGRALVGRAAGDVVELPGRGGPREHEIVSVR